VKLKEVLRVFLMLLPFTLMSCEEDEQCVGCNLNPSIKVKFEALETRVVFDSLLTEANDQISALEEALDSLIGQEEISTIAGSLALLRDDSTKYADAVSLFKNGRVNVDRIIAPGSVGFEQFQDTIFSELYIPVDMDNDASTFYFSFHDLVDTLQISYKRNIVQSLDGVRMRLSNIVANDELSTFDSVRVKCYNVDCGNDLTTVYVYF